MKRLSTLDILKGICICIVVFTHFNWTAEERLKYLFPIWVDMAIPMCMVISGYVYTQSFLRKNILSAEQAYSYAGGELWKRVLRYTIPFLIAWVIELILFRVLSIRAFPSKQGLLREFLTGGVGPGSYYFPVLVQLTFLFPLIYFCVVRNRKKGLIACCIVNVVFEILQWAYGLNVSTYGVLVFRYIQLFAFGCYFAAGGKISNKQCVILFISGVIASYMNCARDITPFFITSWQTTSFLTSLHIVPVFYWLHKIPMKCSVLETVGKASYNIFLTQMVYYSTLASRITIRIPNRLLCLFTHMVICISLGVLFYYIEGPISKSCITFVECFHKKLSRG